MKIKDLPPGSNITDYKFRIPVGDLKQLTDHIITEGWLVSLHAHPGGCFISSDPPGSRYRRVIPTYTDIRQILEWEIVEELLPEGCESGAYLF